MFSWIIDPIKSLFAYIGAFFSGILAEKYRDNKKDLDREKKRDKIDAKPSPKKSEILDKMKKGKLCLVMLLSLFLGGCVTTGSECTKCPEWPVAGPEVAAELEKLPEEEYPALWEWLGRLDKFKQKKEI